MGATMTYRRTYHVLVLMLLLPPAAVGAPHDIINGDMVATLARVQAQAANITAHELGAADPHTASPLPLFERLKREHGVHDRHHPQAYSIDARRRAQGGGGTLTQANTEPLRIEIDFSALFQIKDRAKPSAAAHRPAPSTRLPYSTCFGVGEWFRWNFPSSSQPPCEKAQGWDSASSWESWTKTNQDSCGGSGGSVFGPDSREGDMCNRIYDSSAQNCWGVCLEEDVLRTADDKDCDANKFKDPTACNMRSWLMARVIENVREIESFYRVRKLEGNLKLTKSEGAYKQIYAKYNMGGVECAKDARAMYRLPVAPLYCEEGVAAHTVFFPYMSQYVPNVAGFGGDAAKDQFGRPIVLVMGISVPRTAALRSEYDHRSIILHELVHGLGFGIWNFQNSFLGNGQRRKLVELHQVKDIDGSTDEIWMVVSKRTIDAARTYFNCPNLTRLPLMGENQLGASSRGSHWETRIMNDEFMAYGEGSSVSAITLAVMEDMVSP